MPFALRPSRIAGPALAAALLATLAACGSSAPSGAADATPVPTQASERTPGPSAAPSLAALLPDSAGGVEFVKSSFTGSDLEGLPISLDEKILQSVAADRKLSLSDVQVADARPRDGTKGGVVIAIRVPGADPKRVVDATFSKSEALKLRTLGGKSVYDVAGSGLNVVVYLKDDVMFQVLGAPSDLTEAIVKALP